MEWRDRLVKHIFRSLASGQIFSKVKLCFMLFENQTEVIDIPILVKLLRYLKVHGVCPCAGTHNLGGEEENKAAFVPKKSLYPCRLTMFVFMNISLSVIERCQVYN